MKIQNIVFAVLVLIIMSCDGQSKKNISHQSSNKPSHSIKNTNELKCGNLTFFNSQEKLWKNFRIDGYEFKKINSDEHLYFAEDCGSVISSPDKRIYLFREVINNQIQSSYDYYEAPYIVVDTHTQDYANYVSVSNKKIIPLSLSNIKADFVNQHDFHYENNTYYLSYEFLKKIPQLIKAKKLILNIDDLKEYIEIEPLTAENVIDYNDIAFYNTSTKDGNMASIFLLNEIISNFPDRVVAYLNLGDSYWEINNKLKAKESYQKYINLMKIQGKDSSKIPKRVFERNN